MADAVVGFHRYSGTIPADTQNTLLTSSVPAGVKDNSIPILTSRAQGTVVHADQLIQPFISGNFLFVTRQAASGLAIPFELQWIEFDPLVAPVRSGVATMASGANSVMVAESSIADRTALVYYFTWDGDNEQYQYISLRGFFSGANVRFERVAAQGTLTIRYWVVDLPVGDEAKFYLTSPLVDNPSTITIDEVDRTKSFLILDHSHSGASTSGAVVRQAKFNSDTEVEIEAGALVAGQQAVVQVVQIENIQVQHLSKAWASAEGNAVPLVATGYLRDESAIFPSHLRWASSVSGQFGTTSTYVKVRMSADDEAELDRFAGLPNSDGDTYIAVIKIREAEDQVGTTTPPQLDQASGLPTTGTGAGDAGQAVFAIGLDPTTALDLAGALAVGDAPRDVDAPASSLAAALPTTGTGEGLVGSIVLNIPLDPAAALDVTGTGEGLAGSIVFNIPLDVSTALDVTGSTDPVLIGTVDGAAASLAFALEPDAEGVGAGVRAVDAPGVSLAFALNPTGAPVGVVNRDVDSAAGSLAFALLPEGDAVGAVGRTVDAPATSLAFALEPDGQGVGNVAQSVDTPPASLAFALEPEAEGVGTATGVEVRAVSQATALTHFGAAIGGIQATVDGAASSLAVTLPLDDAVALGTGTRAVDAPASSGAFALIPTGEGEGLAGSIVFPGPGLDVAEALRTTGLAVGEAPASVDGAGASLAFALIPTGEAVGTVARTVDAGAADLAFALSVTGAVVGSTAGTVDAPASSVAVAPDLGVARGTGDATALLDAPGASLAFALLPEGEAVGNVARSVDGAPFALAQALEPTGTGTGTVVGTIDVPGIATGFALIPEGQSEGVVTGDSSSAGSIATAGGGAGAGAGDAFRLLAFPDPVPSDALTLGDATGTGTGVGGPAIRAASLARAKGIGASAPGLIIGIVGTAASAGGAGGAAGAGGGGADGDALIAGATSSAGVGTAAPEGKVNGVVGIAISETGKTQPTGAATGAAPGTVGRASSLSSSFPIEASADLAAGIVFPGPGLDVSTALPITVLAFPGERDATHAPAGGQAALPVTAIGAGSATPVTVQVDAGLAFALEISGSGAGNAPGASLVSEPRTGPDALPVTGQGSGVSAPRAAGVGASGGTAIRVVQQATGVAPRDATLASSLATGLDLVDAVGTGEAPLQAVVARSTSSASPVAFVGPPPVVVFVDTPAQIFPAPHAGGAKIVTEIFTVTRINVEAGTVVELPFLD